MKGGTICCRNTSRNDRILFGTGLSHPWHMSYFCFHNLKDFKEKKEKDVTETIGHLQSKLFTSEIFILWLFSEKSLWSPRLEQASLRR